MLGDSQNDADILTIDQDGCFTTSRNHGLIVDGHVMGTVASTISAQPFGALSPSLFRLYCCNCRSPV